MLSAAYVTMLPECLRPSNSKAVLFRYRPIPSFILGSSRSANITIIHRDHQHRTMVGFLLLAALLQASILAATLHRQLLPRWKHFISTPTATTTGDPEDDVGNGCGNTSPKKGMRSPFLYMSLEFTRHSYQ